MKTTSHYQVLSGLGLRAQYCVLILLPCILGANTAVAQTTQPTPTTVKLTNPLEVTSIEGLLEAILNVVIVLSVPVIVFFIIYAGFLYVTARGNAEQIKQATQALTYAVIGGVIIIGSVAIATIVANIVTSF